MIARWAAPAVWAALVVSFSLVPVGELAPGLVPHADKLVHLTMYFFLAVLVSHGARRPCLACWLSVTAGCGVLGGVIEILQYWVPGRGPDAWDALADVGGAALGSWMYIRWRLGRASRA